MHRLQKNYKEIILVFVGWILVGLVVLLFGREMNAGLSVWNFTKLYCTYFFIFLILLYINGFILLPKLYYADRKVIYFIILAVLTLSVTFLFKPFDNMVRQVRELTKPYWENKYLDAVRNDRSLHDTSFQHFRGRIDMPPPNQEGMRRPMNNKRRQLGPPPPFPERNKHPDLVSLLIFLFLMGGSLAVESNRRLSKSEKERLLVEAQKTKAELAFLKAQVNPHFLFNTLNNIYSMSLMEKEETPDAIMRLSNIMRYVTESSDVEYINLRDELHFIADYVYLNELKGGNKLNLDYQVKGNADGKEIAPLLLISFIENAFKYGISKREDSPITIHITIENELIRMLVKNKIFMSKDKLTEHTGVGIENTRKRLQTLYSGHYSLDIVDNDNQYIINLSVPLVINKLDEN